MIDQNGYEYPSHLSLNVHFKYSSMFKQYLVINVLQSFIHSVLLNFQALNSKGHFYNSALIGLGSYLSVRRSRFGQL
jgi:hypothetical protein